MFKVICLKSYLQSHNSTPYRKRHIITHVTVYVTVYMTLHKYDVI